MIILSDFSNKYLNQVRKIEKECFGKNAWSKKDLKQVIKDNSICSEVIFDSIIESDVLGYYHMKRTGSIAFINTIAIANEFRYQGYGKKIMERILYLAKLNNIKIIQLYVRVSNTSARKLYEDFGFKSVGIIKNYYRHKKEDACVYELLEVE